MKRAIIAVVILLSAAGIAWLQTVPPQVDLATLMPSGALLYVHAADFNRLLSDWDASKVKQDWLASDNYAVFRQSNLFGKLGGVYNEYSDAMAFAPGWKGIGEIAGSESALALYDIRCVQFVYISRIEESQLDKTRLWAVRSKFEQREAAGIPFWLRTDPASGRTVGFTFVKGWLFVATRDDLIARALQLLAGGKEPGLASERWYREATANRPATGDLRMVMNLEALVKSDYFRSYWVQRNVPVVSQYWTGIADLSRSDTDISESRVFLRSADNAGNAAAPAGRDAAARLVLLAPDEAGLYRVWASPEAAAMSGMIVDKLIAPPVPASDNSRYAPPSADLTQAAGTEADLETRIDEPPLPSEATLSESATPLHDAIAKAGVNAVIEVQSTQRAGRTFVRMPCAIVLSASSAWDESAIESALTRAVEPLWTTTGLGAGWQAATAGNAQVRSLDGLGKLYLAVQADTLYLANDGALLGSILERAAGSPASHGTATYAAAFRPARERDSYYHLMTALDFASPGNETGYGIAASSTRTPAFFSQNIASLARALSRVGEIRVTEEDDGARVLQRVDYMLAAR